jgi:hypothetical protein
MAILAILTALSVYGALAWVRPELAAALPAAETWYGELAMGAAAYAGALFAALLGLLIAFALAPTLSAPALEGLVEKAEAELQVPARESLGWFAETWCGLRASLAALLVTGPMLLLFTLAEFAVPPLIVITVPLKLLTMAFFSAYSMLDYSLTLRGVRIRVRLKFMADVARPLLGMGAACALLFWIPCAGVALLPVGVVAGTRLLWMILKAEPERARGLFTGLS